HVVAEVRDEMPQVVFLLGADGAVGEEHEGALARQPPDRMVRIDPRVHALRGRELRAWRTQFGAEHRRAGSKCRQKIQVARNITAFMNAAALRDQLARFPQLPLVLSPTLVEPLPRLRELLGGGPRLF